jgi:hypothetical protein
VGSSWIIRCAVAAATTAAGAERKTAKKASPIVRTSTPEASAMARRMTASWAAWTAA